MNDIVALEVAQQEFNDFIDAMDIDFDKSVMDAEDKAGAEKLERRLLRAIRNGSLVFNDDGEAVYTPTHSRSKHKDPITFRERTGATLKATDNKKKNTDAAKGYAMMGDITGLHSGVFSSLVGIDIKVCESIFALLMD